jgi:UDP-N-acetylglucosamine acyltransferase
MALTSIHRMAAVDPRAELGCDVRVGAFSVIGPEVVLGDGVEVGHHVVLEGRMAVGPRVRISHGAVLGGVPQDLKYKDGTPSGVRIGEATVVRELVTIHRASRSEGWTDIGPGCLLMALSHVAHDCRLGRGVIVINYAGIAGHCDVGDFATIGGHAGMIPFVRVGTHAYVGGRSKITQDVPPFMLADGTPATVRGVNVVGLRRAGVAAEDRHALQDAYRLLYRSGLSPHRAVERLREQGAPNRLVETLVTFVAGSRKGICPPPGGWGPGASAAGVAADAETGSIL